MQASLLFAPFLPPTEEHVGSHYYLQDSATLQQVLVFLHTCSIHKDAVLSRDAYSGYFAPFLLCKEHREGPLTRRCQIRVQFDSGARTKFLATLFQPMTSMSDYQSVPWSHSFQNMYNTHMCKMHLIVEK